MRQPPRLLWAAIPVLAGLAECRGADLLIRNARLVDGTGAPPRAGIDVLVREGRIAALGEGVDAPGVPELDARGATVLPGLVDAHVHLSVVPGSALRHDPPERIADLRH